MADWALGTTQQVHDFIHLEGTISGSALSVDTNDPNTTAPTTLRVCVSPSRINAPLNALLVADAGCVIEIWFYSRQWAKWYRVNQTTLVAFVGQVISNVPPMTPCFLRVQANAGSAKTVGIEFI